MIRGINSDYFPNDIIQTNFVMDTKCFLVCKNIIFKSSDKFQPLMDEYASVLLQKVFSPRVVCFTVRDLPVRNVTYVLPTISVNNKIYDLA
jgi:hypothetical protein